MPRITEDATAHPAGTVITDNDAMRTVALGQVTIGPRSTYQVHETHFTATGRTETALIGPRGSVYTLMPYGKDGAFQAVSFNTGAALRRHGNEVLFIRLGDMIEPTTRDALAKSARIRRATERAAR